MKKKGYCIRIGARSVRPKQIFKIYEKIIMQPLLHHLNTHPLLYLVLYLEPCLKLDAGTQGRQDVILVMQEVKFGSKKLVEKFILMAPDSHSSPTVAL